MRTHGKGARRKGGGPIKPVGRRVVGDPALGPVVLDHTELDCLLVTGAEGMMVRASATFAIDAATRELVAFQLGASRRR